MLRKGKMRIGFFAFIILSLFFLANLIGSEQDQEQESKYVKTTLTKIRQNPRAFKNMLVRFNVRFHKLENSWLPFYSVFTQDTHIPFSAWDKEQKIWVQEELTSDFPFLFISKKSAYVGEIVNANEFQGFELYGEVVSVFNDVPWIEVKVVKDVPSDSITPKVLSSLINAFQFHKEKQYQQAIETLKSLAKVRVPGDVAYFVYETLAEIYYVQGRLKKALTYFKRAYAIEPSEEIQNYIDAINAKLEKETMMKKEKEKKGSDNKNKEQKTDKKLVERFMKQLKEKEEEILSLKRELEESKKIMGKFIARERQQRNIIAYLENSVKQLTDELVAKDKIIAILNAENYELQCKLNKANEALTKLINDESKKGDRCNGAVCLSADISVSNLIGSNQNNKEIVIWRRFRGERITPKEVDRLKKELNTFLNAIQ